MKEQGRYGEAEPLLRRILAIREKTHGVGHPDTLADFNNLVWVLRFHTNALLQQATALIDQGRYHDAEPLLRRALILAEENPNAKPRYLSALLDHLAEVLRAQDRAAAAEPFYRRVLVIEQQELGCEDPRLVVSIHHLAEALKDQGRLVEAELLLRRALAIDEKAGVLDHPDTATDLYRLVEVLRVQGRTAEADPLMEYPAQAASVGASRRRLPQRPV